MTGRTHLVAGVTTALLLMAPAPQAALICFGALLPDIDHGGSKLGHFVKPLSKVLKHRGFTHSLLFCAICTLINPYLGLGVLTHIFLDFLNPKGEALFWPLKANIRLPLFSKIMKTGKGVEYFFLILMVLFCILVVILSIAHSQSGNIINAWQDNFNTFLESVKSVPEDLKSLFSF